MKLIFEKSKKGKTAVEIPESDVGNNYSLPEKFLRQDLNLPEQSEVEVIRHFTQLSRRNFGVDLGFYPLGSCTMKYNPKVNEDVSRYEGFSQLHPLVPEELSQGSLKLMYELDIALSEITGMAAHTLQPAAGAHGELTGLMVMKAHFEDKSEKRKIILIPDSAHGTNPASVTMCGFKTQQVSSDERGNVDIEDLKAKMTHEVVGLMLTNPNTLGLFDENVVEVCDIVHSKGGLVYMDGANMNAIMGIVKPADLGFDVLHLNLHKSFSTPHGCGGPGSGPVGVVEKLVKFLPKPRVKKNGDNYSLDYDAPKSIGQVRAFYGNFGVLVKAYTYIRAIGASGIRKVAENAVLNANYLMHKLKKHYKLPYDRICMHEFVLSDEGMPNHVTTNDIAKRLLDYGFHPPTVYFPMIVKGAIMIEPTETESKDTLDEFADVMIKIRTEAEKEPDKVKKAPLTTPVRRLDAVQAARQPCIVWKNE